MSELIMSVEAAQDNVTGTQLTVAGNGEVSQPPDLITEQEVMFSTAAAVAPRAAPISGRLIDALRIVTAALRRLRLDPTTLTALRT